MEHKLKWNANTQKCRLNKNKNIVNPPNRVISFPTRKKYRRVGNEVSDGNL